MPNDPAPKDERRWPNYCPFCGNHSGSGGAGQRHGTIVCASCHADYAVEFYGAYPPTEQIMCDQRYREHGGRSVPKP